jgi:Transcriptional regulator
MDRLLGIEAFVHVAETGSFAAAARRLGVARSVVTKRVSQLEEHLGIRLFDRTTRAVALTDAGAGYLPRSQRLLGELAEADAAVREGQRLARGMLRVASPTSFGMLHLAPALLELQRQHAGLTVELILNDRLVNPIEEGFDFVVRDVPSEPGMLRSEQLTTNRRVVCAAPAYLERRGTPATPAGLADHDCIHYSYLPSGTAWSFAVEGHTETVRIVPTVSSNNGAVMRQAALAGHGIALLPTFLVGDDLRQRTLVPLLGAFPPETYAIAALYARERRLTAKVAVAIDALKRRFSPPPWDAETMR